MPFESLVARLSRRLERGLPDRAPPLLRLAGAAWAAVSAGTVCRPVELPEGLAVVGVGGAVLGGAGKTPVAVALARALAGSHGGAVVLVGHAYRARPGRARVVAVCDPVGLVGDDALAAARLLAADGVPVVVAPSRAEAFRLAASLGARVVVADGLLQTSPARLADAVLVLDAQAPWGSGACPPLGDLRAPRAALLAASDHLALLTADDLPPTVAVEGSGEAIVRVPSRVEHAVASSGEGRLLARFAGRPVGLILAIARPDRVLRTLASAGVVPLVRLVLADHRAPSAGELARLGKAPVEAWLTTARCATKLPGSLGGAPVLALEQRLDVGALVARLRLGGALSARASRPRPDPAVPG